MPKIGLHTDKSPDLVKSLTRYLDAEEKREFNRPYSAYFLDDGDYDDYYDCEFDDDMRSLVFPYGGYNKYDSPSEDDDFDAEYYDKHKNDKKSIYYYPNILYKSSRIEFGTLKKFSDFCDENNLFLPNDAVNQLMYNKVTHCTLDPVDEVTGDKVIVVDKSYGGLYYTVTDCIDD